MDAYTTTFISIDERAIAAELGVDYAEIEAARAERAAMPDDLRAAMEEYDRLLDRSFLGI